MSLVTHRMLQVTALSIIAQRSVVLFQRGGRLVRDREVCFSSAPGVAGCGLWWHVASKRLLSCQPCKPVRSRLL